MASEFFMERGSIIVQKVLPGISAENNLEINAVINQ